MMAVKVFVDCAFYSSIRGGDSLDSNGRTGERRKRVRKERRRGRKAAYC